MATVGTVQAVGRSRDRIAVRDGPSAPRVTKGAGSRPRSLLTAYEFLDPAPNWADRLLKRYGVDPERLLRCCDGDEEGLR